MNDDLKLMVNTLIEEMGRMEDRINTRMDERFNKVDKHLGNIDVRLESMQHEINACKLERDSVGQLLKKKDQLESRIEE